jgi:hypothetical protein
MEFKMELHCMEDILSLLGSDEAMLEQFPLSVRFWQRAEEKKREGINSRRKNLSAQSEQSFQEAAQLYGSSRQIAELEREMEKLNRTLDSFRNQAAATIFPDKIILKSGMEIECRITEESEDWIRFESKAGRGQQRSKSQIKEIIKASPELIATSEQLRTAIVGAEKEKEILQEKIDDFHHSSI